MKRADRHRLLPRTASGFTLIEVMIAIVIMAVLSLIAWRGLDSMSRANVQLEARTQETAQLMRALQQMQRDFTWRTTVELPSVAAQAPPEEGASPPAASGGKGQASARLLPVGMEVQRPNQTPFLIELVRAAPAAPGHWQRVRWWLQSGTLYRAAGPAAAEYPIPPPQPADRVAVLENINAFEVRAWEPEQGWRRLPAAGAARFPASGLEITLGAGPRTGAQLKYRQVIALD